jgi:NDMA-dependent alcohol dehydrogenase
VELIAMKTQAAVLWGTGEDWKVEEIDLDAPRYGEVLVRMAAAGLCHSDEHLVTGDLPMEFPVIGGHEGAGVVEEVGPGVTTLAPGDHVVTTFFPICGRCPSCVAGHSNLCDTGAGTLVGWQVLDGTARHHVGGKDIRLFCLTGTFGAHTVGSAASFIKIDKDIPLDRAALVSCGVTTGWSSSVYRAGIGPGDAVAIVGVGGLGSAAVQGARLAGASRIFAIDPVPYKREQAKRFGATHVAESVDDAFSLIQDETHGRMCDKAVMTMSVSRGDMMASVMSLVGKRGRVVVTNMGDPFDLDVRLSLMDLLTYEKELVGSMFGSANAHNDVPKLLDLYRKGLLDLDGMITKTYPLSDINEGYQDMRDGKNIRGVVVY